MTIGPPATCPASRQMAVGMDMFTCRGDFVAVAIGRVAVGGWAPRQPSSSWAMRICQTGETRPYRFWHINWR